MGQSRSSLNNIKVVCDLVSEYAIKNDIIVKSYSQFIEMPKKEKSGKRALTDLEVQRIKLGAQNGVPERSNALIAMCWLVFATS